MTKITAVMFAAAFAGLLSSAPARAQSFDCMSYEEMNAAEQKICDTPRLQALDERLDHWYRRALVRAGYFDQIENVRAEQRTWLTGRNACGGNFWCLRRHYVSRIRALKTYVEHV